MKKYLIMLVGIISFLGIAEVKAETYSISNYYIDPFYNISKDNYISYLNEYSSVINTLYTNLLEEYEEEYKEEYPYYYIYVKFPFDSDADIYVSLFAFDDIVQISYTNISQYDSIKDMRLTYSNLDTNVSIASIKAVYKNGAYVTPFSQDINGVNNISTHLTILNNYISFANIFYTNFDFKYVLENDSDKIVINSNPFGNNDLIINNGDNVLQMQNLLDLNIISDPNLPSSNYTEINLNSYPYVALSLKNYNVEEEFSTTMQVKGQYCLTPVYNYGLTERKDVISGTKVQACSPYYDDFTPVRTYILENDITNHAIYYLKSYDTTKENKIKVDSSIFNIHYITSEDEDNPILNINGHNYSAISYDSLTDSATISEEEGYVSGSNCRIGDINCTQDILGGYSITDIFNAPLQFFKNLIDSFINVFTLVTSLISVLPLPMQWFLYLSFMLAIVLGIIKIIL